jgi:hypothetical protein
MIGLLIFYCYFSSLFCLAFVKEVNYETKLGFIMGSIFSFIFGPILLPMIFGDAFRKKLK